MASKSEFLVNTSKADSQENSSITALSDGGFVVTWTDDNDFIIRSQLFKADGTKSGAEFSVNTTMADSKDDSSVSALSGGGFVVTWTDWSKAGGDTSGTALWGQVFGADGKKSGTEFLVNTNTSLDQFNSTVTGLSSGGFVVTWSDNSSFQNVRAQMFNANGVKSGGEFVVNGTTSFNTTYDPVNAALSGGGFVVTWTDNSKTGADTFGSAIHGQIFKADGTRSGAEFIANTTVKDDQTHSAVTSLSGGGFVVTWVDDSGNSGDTNIRGQIFTAGGTKSGAEFLVNATASVDQYDSSVIGLANGGFVVTWTSGTGSGGVSNVKAQVFNADGTKSGSEFLVPMAAGNNNDSALALLSNGNFVASWTGQDSSGTGIWAHIFVPGETDKGVNLVDKPGKNSTLKGTAFADRLDGRDGQDKLMGLDGADTLIGGKGVDKLYGGKGADTFVFATGDSGKTHATADTIFDFTKADHIDLTGWDANSKVKGVQDFDFIKAHAFKGHAGELHFVKTSSDTWIEGDTNGDKKADFVIHLDDAFTLKAGNFDL